MKKLFLGVGLVFAILLTCQVAKADNPFEISVKDKERIAGIQKQIDEYQAKAQKTIQKAEADIQKAQAEYDSAQKSTQNMIQQANTEIERWRQQATKAQADFEATRLKTNKLIETANAQIQKANDELKQNIEKVKSQAEKK